MHSSDEIKALVVEHMRSSAILSRAICEISRAGGAKRPLPIGFRLYAALVPLADRYPRVQDGLLRFLLRETSFSSGVQASLENIGERESRRAVLLWSQDRERLKKTLESLAFFLDGLGFTPPQEAEYTKTVSQAILGASIHGAHLGLGGTAYAYSVRDPGKAWDRRLSETVAAWGQVVKRSGVAGNPIGLPQELREATDLAIAMLAENRIDAHTKTYLQDAVAAIDALEATARDLILHYASEPIIASRKTDCERIGAYISNSIGQPVNAQLLKNVWQVAGNMGDHWAEGSIERGVSRAIQACLIVHGILQDAKTTLLKSLQLPPAPARNSSFRTAPQSAGPSGP